MWKTRAVAVFSALVAASSAAARDYAVSDGGFGPVRFGMTVAQAENVLGVKLKQDDYTDHDSCRYFFPVGKYLGIGFMTANGHIVRVDVDTDIANPAKTIATDRGAKIGDSEARVLALYGRRIRVGPGIYTGPEGHYLRVVNAHGQVRMLFETDGKIIERYRTGVGPAVEYVEGCE